MEYTVFAVKPRGLRHLREIRRSILGAGLKIVVRKRMFFTRKELRILYDKAPAAIIQLMEKDFAHKPVEVGVIIGSHAIARLVALAGEHYDPNQCRLGTLRHTYGQRYPVKRSGYRYWDNAIHRPKAAEEAAHNLKLFFPTVRRFRRPVFVSNFFSIWQ